MYDMHNTFMVWTSNGGYNKISQAILDLGLWELTLPPQPGYPVISRDISWDILDLGPRDAPGYPMGHLGPGTMEPYSVSIGWTSRDVLGCPIGHLGPGTLGPYTASTAMTFRDVLGYPMGHVGPGTLGP